MSHKIFVGIGSNIDREMNIRSCIKILKDLYGNVLISPIYETKAMGFNGPNFYNVPPNKEKLKLVSTPNKVAEFIDVVEEENIVGQIKPFHAGETLKWQVESKLN